MNEQQQPGRNNTCLDADQIIAWQDGALPPREADAVKAHLAICARCAAEERALMREGRQVFDLLSSLDPPPVTHAESVAALARFQEHLSAQNPETFLHHHNGNSQTGTFSLSRQEGDDSMLIPVRPSTPRHRFGTLAQTLVAVLIIAALLGTTLLLLKLRLPSTGVIPTTPPIGPLATPVTVHAEAGGLEMRMQITAGPYFLSEMLAADLSLTNHSQTTFLLQGTQTPMPEALQDSCHPPLNIVMTGGESPYAPNLQSTLAVAISCSGSAGTVQLQPAQTMMIHRYIALTSSGHLTLTPRAVFQKPVLGQDGVIHIVPTAGPLNGRWPSLQISVQTRVPSDHLISLHQQSAQVIVDAPLPARSQLLYVSAFDCDFGQGASGHGGRGYWRSLPTMTIQTAQCGSSMNNGTAIPGKVLHWRYAVGAPGYSIASGTYP
jgi:Putative zinc-finger